MVPTPADENQTKGCKLRLHVIIHNLNSDDGELVPSQVGGHIEGLP